MLPPIEWAALVLSGAIFFTVWRGWSDWRQISLVQMNAWLGAAVCLVMLGLMKAQIKPDLQVQILGATVLTLMAGRAMALLLLMFVWIILHTQQGTWPHAGSLYVFNALLPVLLTDAWRRLLEAKLPPHFFVFVFGIVFFGAGLVYWLSMTAYVAFLAWQGPLTPAYLWTDVWPYYGLLAFSEAFVSGMAMTLIAVYKPHWSVHFSDQRYLNRPPSAS